MLPPPPKNDKISSAFSYNFRLALTAMEAEEKGRVEGKEEGKAEGVLAAIRNLMDSMDWSVEQAMEALRVAEPDRPRYAELLQK